MQSSCVVLHDNVVYQVKVEHLGRDFYARYDQRVHLHPCYHLILVTRGECQVFIGDKSPFTMQFGTLLFINPMVPHRMIVNPSVGVEHTSIVWSLIDKNKTPALFPLQNLIGKEKEECGDHEKTSLSSVEFNLFCQTHQRALRMFNKSSELTASPVTLAILELCFLGIGLILNPPSGSSSHGHHLAEKVAAVVGDSLADKMLDITSVAKSTGKHPNYLSQIFKKETGTTINRFICERRIEQAKNLVEFSGYNISEIADRCGFSSHSYFTRSFQKLVGMSPSEYRNGYLHSP
ncbi:MAG: AraC family transcriptional regulator [Victivallales bacterium]|nr:AraC family transcriptional regulator [Victivallales bacterium]